MLDKNSLLDLARAHAKATLNPSMTYSFGEEKLSADAINKTFVAQLNELGKNPHDFKKNEQLIFEIIEEAINEVLPVKVMQQYSQFAEVKTYGNSDMPKFKVAISDASRRRAKQFVSKVGLAGRYETFKLDGYSFEVETSAYGAASRVEWEEMLDGRFSLADYYNLVLEGLDDVLYKEIAKSLESIAKIVPAHNLCVHSGFDEDEMDKLLFIADAYGKSTIYCTYEFATKMIPTTSTGSWERMSDSMKDTLWNNGSFATYKGHNIVILPQSIEEGDYANTKKAIDPSFAYIIPTGAEKPVKIALQGGAQTKSFENRDWSTEINTYQKMGVATYLVNPGICVYKNIDLDYNIDKDDPATGDAGTTWSALRAKE